MTEEIVDVFHSLQLRDCGRPLSTSVLADWERAIGCRLPGEYRRFLEVFNGGKFYPRFFGFRRGYCQRAQIILEVPRMSSVLLALQVQELPGWR
jgi:hypothetical protein